MVIWGDFGLFGRAGVMENDHLGRFGVLKYWTRFVFAESRRHFENIYFLYPKAEAFSKKKNSVENRRASK